MSQAVDIARYLIHLASPTGEEGEDGLCHMRLQKLLYYVQAWHLAATGTPIFAERIEAWKFGPVVRPLYPVFREFRLAIPASEGRDGSQADEQAKTFVRGIWVRYRGYSATALRDMTHRESPWLDARHGLPADATSDAEITHGAMRSYFFPRYVDLLRQGDPRIDPRAWKESAEAVAAGRVLSVRDARRALRDRRS